MGDCDDVWTVGCRGEHEDDTIFVRDWVTDDGPPGVRVSGGSLFRIRNPSLLGRTVNSTLAAVATTRKSTR